MKGRDYGSSMIGIDVDMRCAAFCKPQRTHDAPRLHAQPMMQYLGQRACMALEDAVTLRSAIDEAGDDIAAALEL